jgi:hypothetical protein
MICSSSAKEYLRASLFPLYCLLVIGVYTLIRGSFENKMIKETFYVVSLFITICVSLFLFVRTSVGFLRWNIIFISLNSFFIIFIYDFLLCYVFNFVSPYKLDDFISLGHMISISRFLVVVVLYSFAVSSIGLLFKAIFFRRKA